MMTTMTDDLGHGMGNAWENKDWAHISDPELQSLQQHYSCLQGHIQILWCSPGHFHLRRWSRWSRICEQG